MQNPLIFLHFKQYKCHHRYTYRRDLNSLRVHYLSLVTLATTTATISWQTKCALFDDKKFKLLLDALEEERSFISLYVSRDLVVHSL